MVFVFNAVVGEYAARISSLGKHTIELAVETPTRAPCQTPPICLYIAPLKRQAMELLVEKTTELGVTEFCPVITAHTQVKDLNLNRLQAIAIGAAEQCGRLSVPSFSEAIKLSQLGADRTLFAAIESIASLPRLNVAIAEHTNQHTKTTAILIGPEGGFSPAETSWLTAQPNIIPVSLGQNILRAETAAILACGLLGL